MDMVSCAKGDVFRLASNVIVVKFHPGAAIEKKDIVLFINKSLWLSGGENFSILLDGNATLEVSDDAMTYASQFENRKWKALAIVARFTSGKLYADYFMKFSDNRRPVKIFKTPAQASVWLKKYL